MDLAAVQSALGAIDRRSRGSPNSAGRWVAGIGRPAVDQAAHVFGQRRHVEGAMLHADIDVVGPGLGVLATLLVGQNVAGMRAVVVDRLIGFQQLDGAVDALGHGRFLRFLGASIAVKWLPTAPKIRLNLTPDQVLLTTPPHPPQAAASSDT